LPIAHLLQPSANTGISKRRNKIEEHYLSRARNGRSSTDFEFSNHSRVSKSSAESWNART